MGDIFVTEADVDATARTYVLTVPRGFDAVANTTGALGAVAPPRAYVVPELGLGIKVVDAVWLE